MSIRSTIVQPRGANKMASEGAKTISSEADPKSRMRNTGNDVLVLIDQAKRMGLVPEIRDLIEDIESLKTIIQRKRNELDTLELIAMESDDENIVELREQLFATVKLVHSEELQRLLSETGDYPNEQTGGSVLANINDDSKDKRSLFKKIRDAFYFQNEKRNSMKKIRTNFRNQTQRAPSISSSGCQPKSN